MIEALLHNLDTLLLVLFAVCALVAASLMIVLRQPMRVALALLSTMVVLGGLYGLLGVHVIAAFQVLIYVGAVMVFMVYVIMLLEVRENSGPRYSRLLVPGLPRYDRGRMWIGMDELLHWNPQRDVAKPYPVARADRKTRGPA